MLCSVNLGFEGYRVVEATSAAEIMTRSRASRSR